MLNIEEELLRYIEEIDDSNKEIFDGSSKEKKIESMLNNINTNIIEESKKKAIGYEEEVSRLNLMNRIQEDREKKVIQSLINILDSISWLFDSGRFFISNDEGLNKGIKAAEKIINRELENIKVIKTPKKGDIYNENYHVCAGFKRDERCTDNEIYEVIREGYIYRDKVIRQAEVIVVNNKLEEDNEYNRN